MAYDKVVDSIKLDGDLTDIAVAIANKTEPPYNQKNLVFPTDFIAGINNIKTGGVKPTPTEEKTINITENGSTIVTPNQGKTLSKVTINVNVPTGGGGSGANVELVEFTPPNLPKFKNKTGTLEIWGWGIKDADVAWMSDYYTFHGNIYSNAIGDTDHPLTLNVTNGTPSGIPEMTRGKCLAVLKL